jgi:Tol biopolymer transport system component
MSPDGTGQRRLTTSAAHEFAPAWSPRGDIIVCLAEMPGAKQQLLRVSTVDGTTARIDGDHLYYGRIAWFPAGDRFLVAAHRNPAAAAADRWRVRARIYSITPDGATIEPLTADGQDTNPWPSPDGRTLVFDAGDGRSWASDRGQWDLWTLSLTGNRRARLTSGDQNDWGAAWSPDGKRIVFSSGHNRVYALQMIFADGTGRRALTRTDRLPDHP